MVKIIFKLKKEINFPIENFSSYSSRRKMKTIKKFISPNILALIHKEAKKE